MSGSVLGPDQVKKINALFPALVAHVADLLSKDHTAVGLMRVHVMVESFDSDEMARIFRELSFISSREKVALVRAAIYELMAKSPSLFVAPQPDVVINVAPAPKATTAPAEVPFVPGFKLNINASSAFHGERPADTTPPAPIVINTMGTHTSKAAEMIKQGDEQQAAQQSKIDAAVAKLRAESAPEVVTVDEAPGVTHATIDAIVDPIAEVETDVEAD